MHFVIQDLRYAVRSLLKSPLLTLVVVASLGLGIGANTTIFSLVNVLLLRPLPALHPQELVQVFTSESDGKRFGGSSYPDYRDFRDRSKAFMSLAACSPLPLSYTVDGRSKLVLGAIVSGNYFPLLGTRAALGRTLQPTDDQASAPPAVMVSQGFWRRRFGSDPGVVGRALSVNGQPFTVVGVAPAALRGPVMGVTPDLFVPTSTTRLANPGGDDLEQRGGRWLMVLGRLEPGVTRRAAQARMDVIMRQLAQEYPGPDSGRVATVVPEAESRVFPQIRGPVIAFVALLMSVVGLVLLVACANVAGLLLARAASRRREIGVRLALGASRGRIVAQLLAESLVLGVLGGVAGLLLAYWGTDLLLAFKPPLPMDITLDLRPDGRVLLFTTVLSILTGVLFGLLPALESTRVEITPALADGPAGSLRRSRLRSALVVGQVAVSLMLLVGAGLLVRGLARATRLDPGFDVSHTLAISFNLKLHGYDEVRSRAFYRDLLERVTEVPGVSRAAFSELLPLGFNSHSGGVAIAGYTPAPHENMEVANDAVSAGYFATMRIPILRGRDFGPEDGEKTRGVAIVNEAFARRYWPGRDPIGQRITQDMSGSGGWLEVVGVARTIKYRSLTEDPRPLFYRPLAQSYEPAVTLVVRTQGDPRRMIPAVRRAAAALDPSIALFDVETMTEHLGVALFPARLATSVLGAFGLLAMLLAAIGLYGVVAYSVGQRTREIGLRMALGAKPSDVLRLVVGGGMRLAIAGMIIGLAAVLLVSRVIANLIFGLSPTDPATLAGIAFLLGTATLFACWLPARRAASVDPMIALRHD